MDIIVKTEKTLLGTKTTRVCTDNQEYKWDHPEPAFAPLKGGAPVLRCCVIRQFFKNMTVKKDEWLPQK